MKQIRNIFIIIIVLLAFISCKKEEQANVNAETEAPKKGEKEVTVFAVNTTKAIEGELLDFLELSGDVKAKTEVDVLPDVSGKLSRVYVSVGDYVRKNQVIAEVDPSRPGVDYKASPVKSPISGTVTSLPLKVGSTVSMQTSIAKVGILQELEIVSYVAEKYINDMKLGLNAKVKTVAFNKVFDAVVSEVSPVVNPQTRMLEVKFQLLEDKESLLKPGLFVDLKVITEKKEGIVKIPEECIVRRYGLYYVFLVTRTDENRGEVEMRQVKLDTVIANKVEVSEGLKPGDEVVIRGQTLLDEKSQVRVIETIQPLTEKDKID
ncbi:MAG: efflux RND transporter periplasmic adaptor subunit [Spirochaetes bacterium]|nr:efflux RND transporter periplasmic adaptor subunit [Spirochaetota bacterium]